MCIYTRVLCVYVGVYVCEGVRLRMRARARVCVCVCAPFVVDSQLSRVSLLKGFSVGWMGQEFTEGLGRICVYCW